MKEDIKGWKAPRDRGRKRDWDRERDREEDEDSGREERSKKIKQKITKKGLKKKKRVQGSEENEIITTFIKEIEIEKEIEIDTENNIKKENVWKLENDIEKDALLQGLIFQLSHFLYLNSF